MSNPFDQDNQEDQDPEAVRGLIAAARASGDFNMDLSQDPEVLGANAFSRMRSQMLDQGKTDAPVQHFVDPRNEMSPEQFLSAAQGRDDVDPNMTMSPEQFSEAAAIRGLKSLAPAPVLPRDQGRPVDMDLMRDPAALRGIAPDEAKARLDQQLQLLPEREASMRPQGTPPTPDVKATTPPPADATDERPASQASVVSPDTRVRLPGSEDKGAMPSLQLRAESKEPPAMRGYTPDAIRGLTGRSSRQTDEGPDVNPLAVLAAALDRNPGRALAEVMSVAGQQKQAWQANRQKQAQQDIENEQKAGLNAAQIEHLRTTGKTAGDWEADKSARDWERIRLAGDAEGRRGQVTDRTLNPENAAQQALVKGIVARSGGRISESDLAGMDDKALGRFAHAMNLQLDSANTPQKAADAATVATSTTNAEQAALIANAPALGAARGVGAAAANETTRAGEVKTAADTSAAREVGADKGRREVTLGKTPALSEVDNPDRYASLTPTELADANKAASAKAVFDDQMGILKRVRADVGHAQVMPSGAKSEYDAAAKLAIGQLPSLTGTGVINENERINFEKMIIQSGLTLGDIVNLGGQGDVVLDQLGGSQRSVDSAYTTKLKGYGLRPVAQTKSQNRAQELQALLQQQPAPQGQGGGFDVPGQLPPMAGRPPPMPADAARAPQGGTVQMRSPSGKVGPVPAAAVDKLTQRGWELVQ
jgi:hypothetical protein